ncbi:MAG: response regulator [Trueperaceae bacterium]
MQDTLDAPESNAVALVAHARAAERRAVAGALSRAGWRVVQAGDGDEALAAARLAMPQIAVVDAHLAPLDDGRHAAVALSQLRFPRGRAQLVLLAPEHDARIDSLASAAGGARVVVGAPLLGADAAGGATLPEDARLPDDRTLWVVDDTIAIRALARGAFERAGWRVLEFEHLREAIDALNGAGVPDAVLLDIHLPDGNGLGNIGVFAAAGAAVVMVSNMAGPDQVELAFAAGASDIVSKPFDLRSLVARVSRAVRPRRGAPPIAGTS